MKPPPPLQLVMRKHDRGDVPDKVIIVPLTEGRIVYRMPNFSK